MIELQAVTNITQLYMCFYPVGALVLRSTNDDDDDDEKMEMWLLYIKEHNRF